ncbi:DUF2510 domain-containing protein [Diaminobutyricibacter tongyongensis]|uniref:DUF2510 domain-containing protein n=1 Tax=Leifsonia tongyongensis TaxID=1268043 RepID=A0A6L9XZC0_9MICO|nr:DUF2510 domain-containing protein [Diaminobutyricibacter tongyongensis]NEN06338.1 DUF2510 domain-containing protein [Diaminobutyricibacter tongyongensis]
MSDTHYTQPGWYDDGSGQQRWWDGTQWTTTVASPPPPLVKRRKSTYGPLSIVLPIAFWFVSFVADTATSMNGVLFVVGSAFGVVVGLTLGIIGATRKGEPHASSIVGIILSCAYVLFLIPYLVGAASG